MTAVAVRKPTSSSPACVEADPATSPIPARYGFDPRKTLCASGIVIGLTLVVLLQGVFAVGPPLPALVRLGFLVVSAMLVPGLPVAVMLRLPSRALELSVAVAVSLSTTLLVAQISVVSRAWHPHQATILILMMSVGLTALAYRTIPTSYRHRPPVQWRWSPARTNVWIALGISALLLIVAALTTDLSKANTFGLITTLSPAYYLGAIALAVAIVLSLTARKVDLGSILPTLLVVVCYVSQFAAFTDGTSTVPTSYVHDAFIEAIAQMHRLPEAFDARFSWAGFFAASAQLESVAGVANSRDFMPYAPLVVNTITIAPLFVIARLITRNARAAWAAVVIYHLFDWYQQDYFAPQPIAMFLFLTIVAVMLWQWIHRAGSDADPPVSIRGLLGGLGRIPARTDHHGAGRTLAVQFTLVLMIVAMVITHQLTPIMLLVALAIFTFLGATRYKVLILITGTVFAAWFVLGASDYWRSHLQEVLGQFGNPSAAVESGLSRSNAAQEAYQKMQYLRMLASGGLAMAGFAGWVMFRRRRGWLLTGLLTGAPFGLVAVVSYGGEVIIRCFMFSSPFLAAFAALLVFRRWNLKARITVARNRIVSLVRRRSAAAPPASIVTSNLSTRNRMTPRGMAAAVVAVFVLVMLVTTNRGLNTAFERTSPEASRMGDVLVSKARSGSTVLVWNNTTIAMVEQIVRPDRVNITLPQDISCVNNLADCALTQDPLADYVYMPIQGKNLLTYQFGYSTHEADRQIQQLIESREYVMAYQDSNVTILRRPHAEPIKGPGQ